MNFKYRYPLNIDCPLIQFLKIKVKNHHQEEININYICEEENYSIT